MQTLKLNVNSCYEGVLTKRGGVITFLYPERVLRTEIALYYIAQNIETDGNIIMLFIKEIKEVRKSKGKWEGKTPFHHTAIVETVTVPKDQIVFIESQDAIAA